MLSRICFFSFVKDLVVGFSCEVLLLHEGAGVHLLSSLHLNLLVQFGHDVIVVVVVVTDLEQHGVGRLVVFTGEGVIAKRLDVRLGRLLVEGLQARIAERIVHRVVAAVCSLHEHAIVFVAEVDGRNVMNFLLGK